MANTSSPLKKDELRPGSTTESGMADLKNRAQETAASVADRAKETASAAAQSAGNLASNLGHKAQETASSVAQSASDLASSAGQRAREATSSVGSGMQHLAGTLRENMPREGLMGRASSTVADTLENSGRYIQQEGLSGMFDDLTNVIRRNPIPAVLIGMGLGFLVARSLRS